MCFICRCSKSNNRNAIQSINNPSTSPDFVTLVYLHRSRNSQADSETVGGSTQETGKSILIIKLIRWKTLSVICQNVNSVV